MTDFEQKYEELKQAVLDYIDEMYQSDLDGERLSWPMQLEELTGWKDPEDLHE